MIKIPYSKMDLFLATITLSQKFSSDEDKERFESLAEKLASPESKMKEVAKYIGIPIETLVNSPNMEKLVAQYDEHRVVELIQILKDEFDLTDKEAWAFVCMVIAPHLLENLV